MTVFREIRPEEIPVLDDFLYEAIFIPEGVPAPPRSITGNEDLQVYVRDFGRKADDRCLVAEVAGKIVGAVWTRVMDDYGHVDDRTPSLAVSLFPEYRGQGIGTELLGRMLEKLRHDGYERVSLSVQKANYALRMYQRAGFETVEDRGEEVLMVCRLSSRYETTKMDNTMKFCQSCGMPLNDAILGTNADGSKNEDYCMYCYQDGKFTLDCSMDEMIVHCAQFIDEVNKNLPQPITKEEYIARMKTYFPQLKRWREQDK